MMSLSRSFLFSTAILAVIGCSSGSSQDGTGTTRAITGSLGASQGSTSTRSYGGIVLGDGVSVAAYKLHEKGGLGARVVDHVGADGSFSLDVEPGARYVVAVEDADARTVLLTFGASKSVLDVRAAGESIDVGALTIAGGFAQSLSQLAVAGVAVDVAAENEYFEAADGALTSARDAVAAAIEATQAACAGAKASLAAAQQACAAAGGACGTAIDEAKVQADASCAEANQALGVENGVQP